MMLMVTESAIGKGATAPLFIDCASDFAVSALS